MAGGLRPIHARAGNCRQCDLACGSRSNQTCRARCDIPSQGPAPLLLCPTEELQSIARQLSATGTIRDLKKGRLLETRRALVAGWNALAERLEAQGEIALGGDVRYFAKHLPPVLTDRERLASELIRTVQAQRSARTPRDDLVRDPTLDRTR